jgi:hypothetical protein
MCWREAQALPCSTSRLARTTKATFIMPVVPDLLFMGPAYTKDEQQQRCHQTAVVSERPSSDNINIDPNSSVKLFGSRVEHCWSA